MVARIVMVVLGVWCAGCAAVIVPPERGAPGEAVSVMVADYGYHSTIILPRSDGGGLVEYAYGDWTYFGNSHKTVGAAVAALVASEQATLGRRLLDRLPGQGGF